EIRFPDKVNVGSDSKTPESSPGLGQNQFKLLDYQERRGLGKDKIAGEKHGYPMRPKK
ncbi:hypothetical protein KQX54_000139, partial [Cotesia glomerata]